MEEEERTDFVSSDIHMHVVVCVHMHTYPQVN